MSKVQVQLVFFLKKINLRLFHLQENSELFIKMVSFISKFHLKCLACHDKMPAIGWLNKQKLIVFQFLALEGRDRGADIVTSYGSSLSGL